MRVTLSSLIFVEILDGVLTSPECQAVEEKMLQVAKGRARQFRDDSWSYY